MKIKFCSGGKTGEFNFQMKNTYFDGCGHCGVENCRSANDNVIIMKSVIVYYERMQLYLPPSVHEWLISISHLYPKYSGGGGIKGI